MYEFRKLSGRCKVATAFLLLWVVIDVASSTADFFFADPDPQHLGLNASLLIADLVLLITCIVFVSRWIYRASSNAHALRGDLTITPGWAVGWYFVPIATWWKPFEAMKETWSASFPTADGHGQAVPPMLRFWWGFWIISNILGSISFRLSLTDGVDPSLPAAINVAASLLSIPTVILLVRIMRMVGDGQMIACRAPSN